MRLLPLVNRIYYYAPPTKKNIISSLYKAYLEVFIKGPDIFFKQTRFISSDDFEKKKLFPVCKADSNPPSTINWYKHPDLNKVNWKGLLTV